jgi:hypothetical protein
MAIFQHSLGALAEHPETARRRRRRAPRRRFFDARGVERSGGLAGATADQKQRGERNAAEDARYDGGGQGGARLTNGQAANNAAPLNDRGSSRTLL